MLLMTLFNTLIITFRELIINVFFLILFTSIHSLFSIIEFFTLALILSNSDNLCLVSDSLENS